jgi:hypothetical protein
MSGMLALDAVRVALVVAEEVTSNDLGLGGLDVYGDSESPYTFEDEAASEAVQQFQEAPRLDQHGNLIFMIRT